MKDDPSKQGGSKKDPDQSLSPLAPLKAYASDQEMIYIAKLMIMGFSEEEIKQILDLDNLFD